jgi:hypothetical protein
MIVLDLSQVPRTTQLSLTTASTNSGITGNLSVLVGNYTLLYVPLSAVIGSLGDLKSTSFYCFLYGCTGITPAAIAHIIAIRDLRIYSMGWDQAGITAVIDSMYAARANYTYANPSLQIGGTNPGLSGGTAGVALPAPTTTPGDGNSNDDWSWNGTYHVPLTTKAKAYYLSHGPDHGTDTFNIWSISANN